MSTSYAPRGEVTFQDIVAQSDETSGIREYPGGNIAAEVLQSQPVPTTFNPKMGYLLTDGVNVLHLEFGPDGHLMGADRYGANDVGELLNMLGDMASEYDDDYWELTGAVEDEADMVRRTSTTPPPVEAEVTKMVANLLEEDPAAAQRDYELQWKMAQQSARQHPRWPEIRDAVVQAMVADGAAEVGSSDVNHGVMRFWKDYGGGTLSAAKWDDFLKDHPLQEPEAMCDNCGSASHHTDECPYSFGANPQ
jgi:hypothetical protein